MKNTRVERFPLEYFCRDRNAVFLNRCNASLGRQCHMHDFIEVAYEASGRGEHHIGGEKMTVSRGDPFVIDSSVPHKFVSSNPVVSQELLIYNCLFAPNALDSSLRIRYPGPEPAASHGHQWNRRMHGSLSR